MGLKAPFTPSSRMVNQGCRNTGCRIEGGGSISAAQKTTAPLNKHESPENPAAQERRGSMRSGSSKAGASEFEDSNPNAEFGPWNMSEREPP